MGSRWGMPAFGLAMGALLFAAAAAGGQPAMGLGMFGIMALYAAGLLVFGSRSETVALLSGRPADERLAGFGLQATAIAGIVAIVVAIAGFLWAIAHGEAGLDFALVAASAGVAYIAALVWFRLRG